MNCFCSIYSPFQLDDFMSNQAIFLNHTLSLPCFADLGCLLQYRGASRWVYQSFTASTLTSLFSPSINPLSLCPRPICGVASIQPVLSVHAPLPQSSPAHLAPLSPQTAVAILPVTAVPMGEASLPQTHHTNPTPQPQAQFQQSNPEQNGILDWLRKLRLHKYYPVFKQLTMEEVHDLTWLFPLVWESSLR